jgi:flagellar motor protein MotB
MNSQIIRKEAGINPQNGDTVLQYFEVQPDNKSLPYFCDVSYLVEQIEKEEYFYVNKSGVKVEVFVNYEPNGEKFVQTKKDKTSKDNLWNLPDFEHSKDDYIRKGTPKPKEIFSEIEVIKYVEKPFNLKNLIPYLLPASVLGLLLPIFYCWFTGGCFCGKPKTLGDTVFVHDTIKIPQNCPSYDLLMETQKVYFQVNKSDTSHFEDGDVSVNTLKSCIQKIKSDTLNFYVDIRGFADYKGSDKLNDKLAANREKSIRQYLRDKGVKDRQIQIFESYGKRRAVQGANEELRKNDRRVEIKIYSTKEKLIVK